MKSVSTILRKKRLYFFLFILAVVVISFLSLWRAIGFHFWRDDWADLWDIIYHPELSIHFNYNNALNLHPASAIEKVTFAKIFGFNTVKWQIFGIFLRILDSLAIALMVLGLTRSKKAGILAGLFAASAVGGLESVTWISAHISAIFILISCVGIYFWALSLKSKKGKVKYYLLATLFITLAILATPARGIFILLPLALWDAMSWYQLKGGRLFKEILIRNTTLVFVVMFCVKLLNTVIGMFSYKTISDILKPLFSNPDLIENYLYSIGNLLISWFYNIKEPISYGGPLDISLLASSIFLLIFLVTSVAFLKKKSDRLKLLIFFMFWLFLLYIPNWLYDKTLIVGSSHRYLTVSAVSIPVIAAVLISKLKMKKLFIFSIIFICLNIIASNRVLLELSQYRSYKVVQPIWDRINSDVPEGMKNMIFMYYGSDLVWGTSMTWSFSVPFGIMRGYTNPDDFPIVTGDRALVVDLLCEENVYRPTVPNWTYQKTRIPISHLFAWVLKDGNLTNISDKERENFSKEANCDLIP